MFTRLIVPRPVLDAMIAHARGELPNECCGLLAGRVEGETGLVTARFALRNDLASPTEYRSNPRDLLDAMKATRRDGTDVLAVYHSHPASAPVPSRTDRERNYWGTSVVHFIVGFPAGEPVVCAWWLDGANCREAEWRAE